MNHKKAMFLLEGFEPGELTPREKSALDSHLAGCASCSAKASNVAPLGGFFAEAAAFEPEGLDVAIESVRQRTMRAVRAERPMPFLAWARSLVRVEMLVPAGAAAVLLLAVWVKMPGHTESRQPDTQVARLSSENRVKPVGGSSEFVMLRSGSDVTIQWLDKSTSHKIRQAQSPVAVRAAGKQVVRGHVWNETDGQPAPGTVTYYLID